MSEMTLATRMKLNGPNPKDYMQVCDTIEELDLEV
jgi:hypothetical protein